MTPVKFSTNPIAFLRAKVAPITPFVPRLSERGIGVVWAFVLVVMGLDLCRVLANFYEQQTLSFVLLGLLWALVLVFVLGVLLEYGGLFYLLKQWQNSEQVGELILERATPKKPIFARQKHRSPKFARPF